MPQFRGRPSWLIAALLGLLVAATVGAGNLVLLRGADRESMPMLADTTEAGAGAVGRTVAAQLSRALGYGIPLSRLNGVDAYLHRTIEGSPQVAALAVLDADGAVMFSTQSDVDGRRFPLYAGSRHAGFLVLQIALPGAGTILPRLELGLAAVTLFCGLLAAIVSHLFLQHHLMAAERRLGLILAAMRDGDFRMPAIPPGRGVSATAFSSVEKALEPLRSATQRMDEAIATVRAIDFDGSLKSRLDQLLKQRNVNIAPADVGGVAANTATLTRSAVANGLPWRLALIIGAYFATAPLIANYAADREWPIVSSAWWPSLPIIVETLAISVVAALAARTPSASRTFLAAAGVVVAAIATGGIALSSGYEPFLVHRMAAGAGLGLILGSTLGSKAGRKMQPTGWGLILFAGLCAGPVLGGILAEAIGRRSTFLTLGLMLALGLVIVRRLPIDPADTDTSGTSFGLVPILGGLGVFFGAIALVVIPMGPGYDHYLEGGMAIGGLGFAAILLGILLRLPAPCVGTTLWALPIGIIAGAGGVSILVSIEARIAPLAMLVISIIPVAVGLAAMLHKSRATRHNASQQG